MLLGTPSSRELFLLLSATGVPSILNRDDSVSALRQVHRHCVQHHAPADRDRQLTLSVKRNLILITPSSTRRQHDNKPSAPSLSAPITCCSPTVSPQCGTPVTPTLYVLNAAALSKPHALAHLAADLKSAGASVAFLNFGAQLSLGYG